jgi:peptidoglycan/xylan/chitin deacetylase (PgdA/CDA1 family)
MYKPFGYFIKSRWMKVFIFFSLLLSLIISAQVVDAEWRIPVLAYHYIAEDLSGVPAGFIDYYVTPEQFENHLDIIQAYGYTSVSLADLSAFMEDPIENPLPAKPVVITFDDGQQGIYEYAYPALKERNMTATFYIVTDYVEDLDMDRCVAFNWDGVPSCQVIWPELVEMAADGFEIGSHTKTHPGNLDDLYENDPVTLTAEIVDSRQALEDHLGENTVSTFAYPHGIGAENAAIKQILEENGFIGAVAYGGDYEDLVDPATDNIFALPRMSVHLGHTNILNVDNPWYFFITRLEPDILLPVIANMDIFVTDGDGAPRSQFYPGDEVIISVQLENWGEPVDVKAQLNLENMNGIMFDSHPDADQISIPLQANELYEFTWTIPDDPAVIGPYDYQFRVMDLHFLMQYFRIISTAILFEVKEKTPVFYAGADVIVNEDSGLFNANGWASDIDAGLPTYPDQVVIFSLSDYDPTLFSEQPQINANGDLSFVTQANAYGSTQVTVFLKVMDSTDGTVLRSAISQTFNITIVGNNDAPTFTMGADIQVDEDSGAQTITEWVSNINPGQADEVGQTLTFQLSGYGETLFSVSPAINEAGDLSFTPAENANGSTIVSIVLSDNGGTENGGNDTSDVQTFSITINAVNDIPTFTKGQDIQVDEDCGMQIFTGWATKISPGPADEFQQTLTFHLSGYDTTMFSVQPEITETGDLTFTPSEDANGSTTLFVRLSDDGGTANGGGDSSDEQTFTITVDAVNDVPRANDDVFAVDQSRKLVIEAPGILANDFDVEGDSITVELVSSVNHGKLEFNQNGSFSYSSRIGFAGTDYFIYRVWDGQNYSDPAIVRIIVPIIPVQIYLPMIINN